MKSEYRSSGVLILGLAAAALLTGCAGSPPWGRWSKEPSEAKVNAAMGRAPETFIYFSDYEVYREEHTKEYVYQQNGTWVHSSLPPAEIPESKLGASPWVEITMDGTPESDHAAVKQAHPAEAGANSAVGTVQR